MKKIKIVFYVLGSFILFFVFVDLIYKLIKVPGKSMYDYSLTKKLKINGVVTKVQISRHTEVNIDDIYYNILVSSKTKNLENEPVVDFVLEGDSIIKDANNDTFFIIRKNTRYTYILP